MPTVQGKVALPDGSYAGGGNIFVRLLNPATAPQLVDGGEQTADIGSDGSVSITLSGNDEISPSGTYYAFEYRVREPLRANWTRLYSIDASPDPIDIGDLTEV